MYIKIILLLSLYPALSHSASIYFNEYHNGIKVESWKDLRDKDIVKQDLDFSCGAASIATLLNGYYNQKVTEEEVLKIMDKGDMMASFDDMQKA